MGEPFGGSGMKQLWMKKHIEYFNMPPKERVELGLKFPVPSEYGVNPRDDQIKNFITSTMGGDESKFTDWQEAAEIHEMLLANETGDTVTGGSGQLAKRLAELGFPTLDPKMGGGI